MANPVRPQDIIDLQGLSEDLTKLKSAFGDFDKEASAMMKTLGDRTKEYNTQLRSLLSTIKGTNPSESLDGQAKEFRELEAALKGVKSATDALTKANETGIKTIKELEAEKKQYIKALKQLKSETNEETEGMKALEKAIGNTSKQINTLSANYKQASKDIKVAKGSYDELQKSLTADIRALKSLEGAFSTSGSKIDINKAKIESLTKSIKQKQDALKQVDSQMGINTRNVGNYSSAMAFLVGGVRGAIGSFGTWGIAIIAVAEAMQRLNGLVLMGEQLRRSQIGVENVSSNATEAGINLDFLRDKADKLGLEIESLNKDFKSFAGATEGTVLEGAKTREMFSGITDAIAAMQLTSDDASSAMRAFSQSISKGTLQSEELKGQLAEHLPMAIRVTAKALGLTTEELFKQMKAGELLASDVLPKVAEEFKKLYGADALKNAETLTGSTARLTNSWKEFLNAETSPIRKFLIWTYDKVSSLLNLISRAERGSADERRQIEGQSFGGLTNSGDMASALTRLKATSKAYISDYEKRAKELDTIGAKADAKKARDLAMKEALWYKDMVDMFVKQKDNEVKLVKDKNDAKGKAQDEANAKALKKQQKEDNDALIAARKSYQVELRRLDANEKNTLALLKNSNLEGLLSDEQYAAQKLQIEGAFTNKRITLADEYFDKYGGMQEELKDDFARYEAEQNQNLTNNLELKKKIYKDYYDAVKKDFNDSFLGFGKDMEEDIKTAEALNNKITNLSRIALNREAIKKQNKNEIFKGQGLSDSEVIGFDSQSLGIDIEEISRNMASVQAIFQKYQDKFVKIKDDALTKIYTSDMSEIAREESKNNILIDFEHNQANLIEGIKTKLASKEIELDNKVTENSKINSEKITAKKKEEIEKQLNYATQGIEVISQIENSISSLRQAYSERNIGRLERQKEKELLLAGDNKEAQVAIEREFQKKIIEERKKQDKRDKLSNIFQIILNNQLAVIKGFAQGGIAGAVIAKVLGSIALATAIATPLPEYAKGKRKGDSYEGLAIAGEKGAEIMEKDGKQTLVDKPSVVYVDPKTRIYTASETNDILRRKNNDKISSEWNYNNTYLRKTNKYERERNNNSLELSRLRRTLKEGIGQGFETASIVINNSDGSTNTHRGGSRTSDITKRAIYR